VWQRANQNQDEQLIPCPGATNPPPPTRSPALHLIQQIRDEAHRFAITGHRNRRGKARRTSVLESITARSQAPASCCPVSVVCGLMAASVDEIAQVEGISRPLAERIYQTLH
jgi:excinuclease ABC subunit C